MKLQNILLFGVICSVGFIIGGYIAASVFFGLITFIGFVFLVESIPFLKFIVYKSNKVLDVLLFLLTVIATIKLGVTITGGLTLAGLGFSMLYAPYMRSQIAKSKSNSNKYSQNGKNKHAVKY